MALKVSSARESLPSRAFGWVTKLQLNPVKFLNSYISRCFMLDIHLVLLVFEGIDNIRELHKGT